MFLFNKIILQKIVDKAIKPIKDIHRGLKQLQTSTSEYINGLGARKPTGPTQSK